MKTINARILAYLLDIKQEDANKKIHKAIERINGNMDQTLAMPEDGLTISVEDYDNHWGENIGMAIKSIRSSYLKNSATRNYIMDYPVAKLVPAKKTGKYPGSVSIPTALRSLLTASQKEEILECWNSIYAKHPAIEKFGTVFKS